MRMLLGYVPMAIVAVPFLVCVVRQSLYYKGCMDGFGFVLVAIGGFVIGGVLNVVFLIAFALTWSWWLSFEEKWKRNVAKGGIACAAVTLVVQIVCLTLLYARDRY